MTKLLLLDEQIMDNLFKYTWNIIRFHIKGFKFLIQNICNSTLLCFQSSKIGYLQFKGFFVHIDAFDIRTKHLPRKKYSLPLRMHTLVIFLKSSLAIFRVASCHQLHLMTRKSEFKITCYHKTQQKRQKTLKIMIVCNE